ncbi:winged helix-turn-helix transcriptional regulator [Pseudomonas gingeri]|uniref:winged helix-turn-helix transcriptional regulator n=1 Tax=Pseudomonas gingeri TaxID=117681 RepID=UPI0015A101C8|nr:helix-turn-helix domain-containing protein [Pseudomonas gingeri]NWD05578.1 helix-turn-helix transcriptional regulator [Pseudomonas gingeri]NWE35830.1 helix-turn-helix transcriptional regulator [Pseudomonas gingeri]NWE57961.1 helix-turn-helix transcriptional regulator [Pseudomonas gingeri]NWF01885.1 helix-turn-helix transcriptional regulator [Pseudomonas gingeri]
MAKYRENPAYDVFAANCPARVMLDRLADKWVLLLIDRFSAGEHIRFNQLRRDLAGISQKVLSQTLKRLERDGLVEREVFPTVPPTVEYSLTELGATLGDTVERLAHWAESNMASILQAQQDYDERAEALQSALAT